MGGRQETDQVTTRPLLAGEVEIILHVCFYLTSSQVYLIIDTDAHMIT